MSKCYDSSTLSEGVEKVKEEAKSKGREFTSAFESEYEEVCKAFDQLKPSFEALKNRLGREMKGTKESIESKVVSHPWAVVGGIGLSSFIVGWIYSRACKK